jgi:hypothetical protein
MKLKNLLKLIDLVHQKYGTSTPYICGGLPRDKYLGKLVSAVDVDFTTGDKTVEKLSLESYKILKEKFNIVREIKQDGHSSIYFKNMKIDFSSNYIVPYAEKFLKKLGKKPSLLELESYSRDFGCNSLLLSLDFKDILDPTGQGKKDCNNKTIKTILPPAITFKPNPKTQNNNRAIRAIYLACKLGFDIDQAIIDYLSDNPVAITLSDPKSLSKKLNQAYELDSEKTIYYLNKMNLWNYIPINNMLSDEVLDLLANRAKRE